MLARLPMRQVPKIVSGKLERRIMNWEKWRNAWKNADDMFGDLKILIAFLLLGITAVVYFFRLD